MKRVIWESWCVRALRHHDGWGMLNIRVRDRVLIDIVVLRRNVVARIVSRHDCSRGKGRRKDGKLLIVDGDGRHAGGINVIQIPGCRGSRSIGRV